jgi:DNA-binding LytR/AlgR family response regulator
MTLINKYFKHGLLLSVLLGALFAILGVYNTSSIPYFNRFVFWTATMVVGLFGTGLSVPFVFNKLLPDKPLFLQLTAVVLLISVPVTLVLAAFDHNYGIDWSVYIWLVQYRYVLIISAILIFGGYYVLKAQGLIESEKDDVSNLFLKRLPLEFQHAELYAVSSEDHYLKAITSEGSTLILMRLSDAIKELENVQGMQTHRSWWVAKSAVLKTKRMNGKLLLELKSGEKVPVSRTFDKAVKDAFDL